jgi:hypothetical protein
MMLLGEMMRVASVFLTGSRKNTSSLTGERLRSPNDTIMLFVSNKGYNFRLISLVSKLC